MAARHVVVTLSPVYAPDSLPFRSLTFASNNDTAPLGRASKSESKNLVPAHDNAWFDSRVMSRDHAVLSVSLETQTVFVRDHGSMHGTLLNEARIVPKTNIPIKNGDILTFGSEVLRGDQTFRPIAVRFNCKWHDYAIPTETAKVYKNTFSVPDDDDDVEILDSPSKPAPEPVEPTSDSSDFGYGSDISRPLDLTSPGTSPEVKQSDLPKPTPAELSSAYDPQSDPVPTNQDPQITRSSPPGSFPIDFRRSDETDSEFDDDDDVISESYSEWIAKRDEPSEYEDSVANEQVFIYDDNEDNSDNGDGNEIDKENYNEQVEEAPHTATSPAPEADLLVPPPIVNEAGLHLPKHKETVSEPNFTADHLATVGNPEPSFAGPSVLDDASATASAAQGLPSFIPVQDISALVDYQRKLRDSEIQRVPSPSDKAMARPPQYNFYEGWPTGIAPWECFRLTPASESFPFDPHRSTGYLRHLNSEAGPSQPFVGSQALDNEKATEPAKTGVSIADIVEATEPLSGPSKRKVDEFESDLDDLKLSESQENTQDSIPDAQPRPELNAIIVSDSQVPASSPVSGRKESRRKRAKTRQSSGIVKYATAAVIGAVVGGISTVAALAALPSDYFE
ncbi:uncharacterized protein TRUGW13939_04652 [Talaromyces rugulosus]|uniref:FHA domain-containing protein n=1 Tax=Talaromyces rugulosus TaxID=121627 RepID=A0A7H8QVL4_TALRU|nr:uncharacterized protein TRUGW13939_04652 [Talaromyces rugulosus]QKX57535.1 hypothetical protein TRUGW13939_04652 [Talaromyces rugulosus]